ncbi:MAG: baseplate protein [Deltaproteobacteria bacterium]|nr:MAG: baseplate protein [Deltaproteobacteria bacterium]
MSEAFLGTGWAFPIQIDDTGGIRMRSREHDIREAIGIVLGTRLGERVMRPEFGSGLADLVFDPNDANLAGRIEFLVRKALERWEPRIVLKEVRARPAGERMEIDVRYIVRRTNREDNVVVPFFAGALP